MSAPGRFNLSSWTLRHQALVTFILALVTILGMLSYTRLSQSEESNDIPPSEQPPAETPQAVPQLDGLQSSGLDFL